MKTIRKDWPEGRQYVKGGNTSCQVDLRRKHYQGQERKVFTSRDDAFEYAGGFGRRIAKQVLNSQKVVTFIQSQAVREQVHDGALVRVPTRPLS